MRSFCLLVEELESRPDDADRVAALARWLRVAGREAGDQAAGWLVVDAPRARRPVRLAAAALAEAAATLARQAGMAPWLFDAGREAGSEAVEAIALLLPWPEAPWRPALADWLDRWHAAGREGERAIAIAAAVAALDDAVSRRWAARAACGLAKPAVDAWQWQRAWAEAFGEDVHAVAWRWQRADAASPADAVPRPHAFAPLPEAPADGHAALLAAWRAVETGAGAAAARQAASDDASGHAAADPAFWVEPRWRGWRVQVVRGAGGPAVWRRAGPLLNALLPPALLAADAWPEHCAIEAILVGWRDDRAVPVADALAATPARRRAAADLRLVVTDWHRWGAASAAEVDPALRRARLHARWPAPALDEATGAFSEPPPAVFASPALRVPDALAARASAARAAGWSGLVLRHGAQRWAVRAAPLCIRAVLLYLPSQALVASAAAAASLAFVDCGFAVWNRLPRSPAEQHAAMRAAMAGEFLPAPDDAPGLPALRLLPLARLPLGLPNEELQRLHAWARANAGQRFGGVHAVAPVQVFEIGFARVRESRRHRLGAVVDDARVLRWIADAPPGAAQLAGDLTAGG